MITHYIIVLKHKRLRIGDYSVICRTDAGEEKVSIVLIEFLEYLP
jgi:mRNA-degrading endonuclease RelE of RelBE toxin-antitoxin system